MKADIIGTIGLVIALVLGILVGGYLHDLYKRANSPERSCEVRMRALRGCELAARDIHLELQKVENDLGVCKTQKAHIQGRLNSCEDKLSGRQEE